MSEDSPFHPGEIAIQARQGVRDRVEKAGQRFIRDHMPDQHRDFFRGLGTLFIGSVDENGDPWASLVAGEPGFIRSPTPRSLVVRSGPVVGDILEHTLRPGASVGVLGLDFGNRRRNRMNGRLGNCSPDSFEIEVEQSFGNCPKYINARQLVPSGRPDGDRLASASDRLVPRAREILSNADTMFIATCLSPDRSGAQFGADVSHRGGLPGFIGMTPDGAITIPDYKGNSFFNTLGNIVDDGRAGVMIIDFPTGDILQLTGKADIGWHDGSDDEQQESARQIRVRPLAVRLLPGAFPFTADGVEYSPFHPKECDTG